MSYHQALDEGYFNWLYSLVAPTRNINPARTYYLLLEQMFKKEFRWSVPNDDNRVEDGKELRAEFLDNYGVDSSWMNEGCSVLEMLIALARRATFEGDGEIDEWFWLMVENLGLRQFTDEGYSDWVAEKVDVALDIFIDREYDHDGEGGLFPLHISNVDQREVEIWYQMSCYILEADGD